MGPAKWRESHVRFLRSATHETALGYDTFCRFQKRVTSGNANSPLFEIAPVLVCLDHAAKKQLKLPGDHQAVRDSRGGVSDRRGP
jgi:hypothetical protein